MRDRPLPTLMAGQHYRFSAYGWKVCLWVLIPSFQVDIPHSTWATSSDTSSKYGYHVSALNQLQAVLTCKDFNHNLKNRTHYGLPTCIPMSDATFSVVTSVITVGGLLGSLVTNIVMERWGRKGAVCASASSIALGACLMAASATVSPLIFGR
jgi:SP family facilitated glucose transporter-like MFS transporter 3